MNWQTTVIFKRKALAGAIITIITVALMFIFLPLTSQIALAETFNDYEYSVNPDGTTATITGYTGTGGDVTIPETIDEITVTAIGGNLFTEIPVTSVTIPKSILTIDSGAFRGCTSLISIIIDSDNPNYQSTDGIVFSKDTAVLVHFPNAKAEVTAYTVPETVTTIGDYAFDHNQNLQSITLTVNVTQINSHAFDGCSALRDAYFLSNAPVMGENVFSGCTAEFTVYYTCTSSGFTDPWNGYTAEIFDPSVTHTVSFDLNGAEGTAPDTQTVFEGTKAVRPADPTNGDKYFGGWYTESTCESQWDFDAAVTSDLSLFAKWKDFNGSGTEDDPYQVSTPEQLNAVRNYPDAHFIMTNDIDMTAATSEGGAYWNNGAGWEPIGNNSTQFMGVFNGESYTISGLYINRPTQDFVGLFGDIDNSGTLVSNLDIEGYTITGHNYVGVIAGQSGTVISQCNIYGHISETEYNEDLVGNEYVGGITGNNIGSISESSNGGFVVGDKYVGGIAGYSTGTISECSNYAGVGALTYVSGGIVGENHASITSCHNKGYVTGDVNIGGITGRSYGGTIIYCSNTGTVYRDPYSSVGGIVGNLRSGSVIRCYNTGWLWGFTNSGSNEARAGGIVGFIYTGSISDCFNMGKIDSLYLFGGIVGSGGSVTRCYNAFNKSGNDIYGFIKADGSLGTDVYYFYEGSESLGDEAKTYDKLCQQATFENFNFSDVWQIIEGERFPTLQNLPFEYATGLSLDKESIMLSLNDSGYIIPTMSPESRSCETIIWTSSDESVVTIDGGNIAPGAGGKMRIYTEGTGTAIITGKTLDGGFIDTCIVNVIVPVTSVTLSDSEISLFVGDEDTLTATVSPEDATNKNIFWLSDNTSVATVDQDGNVTAVDPGNATITATADGVSDTCLITVEKKAVTGISLNKTAESVSIGNSFALTATVSPSDATYPHVTWSSSKTAIATVNQNGNVTAVAPGKVTITATADGKSASCNVTVNPSQVTVNAAANNASYGSVSGGGTYTIDGSVTLRATANTGYNFVRWTENGSEVSTNTNYVFSATTDRTLVAVFEKNAEDPVQPPTENPVQPPPLIPVGISCTKTDASVYGGSDGSITVSASGGNSGSYEYSINGGASWQAANVFGGLSAGTYTAAVRDASNTSNIATCSVSVGQPSYMGCVAAKRMPSKANAGTALTIIPPAAPRGYTIISLTYSSTNPAVATVDASGSVTFLAGGKAKIITKIVSQMTDKRGRLKTKTTTVKRSITVKQPVASITLNLGDTTIARKQRVKLILSFAPATASNKKVKWTTSNRKIATVSSSGVVTGKAGGTAVITCTAKDGSGVTASCTVTVTPIYPTGIRMSKAALTVKTGRKATLRATITPRNTDFKTLIWASSDPSVATVDAKGKVRGITPGTAVITATTSSGQTASCTVIVP